MKNMRMLGSQIQKFVQERNMTLEKIGHLLDCSVEQVHAIFEGRVFPSFSQLEKLAEFLGTTMDVLLSGDEDYYAQTVVHCMGQFSDPQNREEILDIIDDYLSLKAAINS